MTKFSNQLLDRLRENDPTLTEIYLSDQRDVVGNYEVALLVRALWNNTSVRELDISLNGITTDGIEDLPALLKRPTCNLVLLDLSSNKLGDKGACIIAEALAKNTKLRTVYLSANGIRNEGARCLAHALQENRALENMFLLESPLITDAGKLALAGGLLYRTELAYEGPGKDELLERRTDIKHQNARAAVVSLLMMGGMGRSGRQNANTADLIRNAELPIENEIYRIQASLLWETRNDENWFYMPGDEVRISEQEQKRRKRACIGCLIGTAAFAEENDRSRVFCSAYCQFIHYHNLPDLRGPSRK